MDSSDPAVASTERGRRFVRRLRRALVAAFAVVTAVRPADAAKGVAVGSSVFDLLCVGSRVDPATRWWSRSPVCSSAEALRSTC